MIRTPSELRETRQRLRQFKQASKIEKGKLRAEGLSAGQINRVLEPSMTLIAQLEFEIARYERLKSGTFSELRNLEGIGQLLVGLRIALGITQRELARRLGVHETQVSRDERNDYYGITAERINRVLEAMGVQLRTTVKHLPTGLRKSA